LQIVIDYLRTFYGTVANALLPPPLVPWPTGPLLES
jgi:hypothetical protein